MQAPFGQGAGVTEVSPSTPTRPLMRTLLLLGALGLTSLAAQAQTTVAPGDFVFVTVNADQPDLFAFAPLVDLAAGTEIRFTDNTYKENGDFRANEGTYVWTVTDPVSAFTIVTITGNSPSPGNPVASTGTVTKLSSFGIDGAAAGDQIFAYQTLPAPTDTTVIAGINWGSDWITASGTATTNSTSYIPASISAFALDLGTLDNYTYSGPTDPGSTGNGTVGTVRSLVLNVANWTGDDAVIQNPPTAPNNKLPVELVSFTASSSGATAHLRWATASETNNAAFHVERRSGDAPWADAGRVAGHGTTAERQQYALDVTGLGAGRHAFRLRQVDLDGAAHYSAAVEVDVAPEGAYALAPTAGGGFRLTVRDAQAVDAGLYDVAGRRVATLARGDVAAGSSVAFAAPSGLASGVYVVRVTGERFAATRTLVVR